MLTHACERWGDLPWVNTVLSRYEWFGFMCAGESSGLNRYKENARYTLNSLLQADCHLSTNKKNCQLAVFTNLCIPSYCSTSLVVAWGRMSKTWCLEFGTGLNAGGLEWWAGFGQAVKCEACKQMDVGLSPLWLFLFKKRRSDLRALPRDFAFYNNETVAPLPVLMQDHSGGATVLCSPCDLGAWWYLPRDNSV